jgi:hypothetical protein
MVGLRAAAMGLAEVLGYYDQYVVPEYQRVYGWGEVEIARLFSDVERAMRPGAPSFFLGTIYLAVAEGERTALIADGQQRMVTAMMAYAAARDLCEDQALADRLHAIVAGPAEGRFRLLPRDSDAAFFATWVQERGATLKSFGARDPAPQAGGEEGIEDPELGLSESQRNIIANRDMIVQSMRMAGPAGIAAFLDFMAKEARLVVIVAPTLEDARNAYASTQNRGLRQSETDKLKAELIADCPVAVRARLAGQWEECEAILGREDLAELLRLMIMMHSERKPQHAIEVDLFKAFDLPRDVERFINLDLVPSARAYRRLCDAAFTGGRNMRRINGHIVTLLRTTHDSWKAPALLAIRTFENDATALEAVLRKLERLAAVLMIRGTDPNLVLDRYLAIVREIKAVRSPDVGALDISETERAEARRLLADTRFATRDRFRMPLLLKINDLLAGEVLAVDPKTVSCEHILPRNVPSASPWRAAFRSKDGRRYEGGRYVHMLGNLTVLGHAENRLADTRPFPEKRPIFKRSPLAISNDVGKNKTWSPEIVLARTERLGRLLAEHWEL